MNIPTPRMPAWRWFLPRQARGIVESLVMTMCLILLGLASSMQLLGTARVLVISRRGIGTTLGTSTVSTSPTNAAATGISSQKKEATLSSGREVVVIGDTATNAQFWWSDDKFATKTQYTSGTTDIAGWSNGSFDVYTDSGGTQRAVAVWKQSGTGGGRTTGNTYVMVGAFNTGATTLTWGTAVAHPQQTSYDYPDVAVRAEGTGGLAMGVRSYPGFQVSDKIVIDSSGVPTVSSQDLSTATTGGAHSYPSVCCVGNNFGTAWSGGATGVGSGIRFRLGTATGTTISWGSEVSVDTARYTSNTVTWVNCRWNSHDSMVVIGGQLFNGTTYDIYQYESTNFTSFPTARGLLTGQASNGTNVFAGSLAIDALTGDSYFIGGAGNGTHLQYYKWTRGTATFGSVVTVDTTFFSSVNEWVYAWYSPAPAMRFLYTKNNASPFTIVSGSIT